MSQNQKQLTLTARLRVIEKAKTRTRTTKTSIASDLNSLKPSPETVLVNKDSILLNVRKPGLKRRVKKDGKYATMEKALVQWLPQAHTCLGIAVNGAVLKE